MRIIVHSDLMTACLFIEKKTSKIYIVQSAKIPTWILKEDEKDFI